MARTDNPPAITLLGQAASGKTNLLAAFINHHASWLDLETGASPLQNVSIKARFEGGGEEERAFHYLGTHYVSMLKGREYALEGTNAARRYKVAMTGDEPPRPEPDKSRWSLPKLRTPTVRPIATSEFEIVDGRGADAAPSEMITSEDKDAMARRQVYRDGMDDSSGFVIFMPLMSDDEGSEAVVSGNFLKEVNLALDRKANNPDLPRLKQVALCFTKCERAFSQYGVDAAVEAADPTSYEAMLSGNAVLSNFRSLIADSMRPDEFDLRVFPVSTYGFIHKVGSPNYYPWEYAPGLLTRAVNKFEDYDNDEIPDYKDHFPFPVEDDQARSMWRPFNIAPPLIYALTGRVTGPISLPAQDALRFAAA